MRIKKRISFILIGLFLACNPSGNRTSEERSSNLGGNLGLSQAFILDRNPVVISPASIFRTPLDISSFVSDSAQFITNQDELNIDCNSINQNNCIQVLQEEDDTRPIQRGSNPSWFFQTSDQRFLGVSNFYHVNQIWQRYSDVLNLIGSTTNTAPRNQAWYKPDLILSNTLKVAMECNQVHTASYSPTQRLICLSGREEIQNCSGNECIVDAFPFKQDPSILYHEFGHALTDIMMNASNTDLLLQTTLGQSLGFDEAGAINEGISDFYSHAMNNRTQIGEWALGAGPNLNNLLPRSRPIRESDSLHQPGISLDEDERLSYPLYINYEPHFDPGLPLQGVHNTGMITSHFFTNLSSQFVQECNINQSTANNYILLLISETLNSIGAIDPTFGIDKNQLLMPGNYRFFYQRFAAQTLRLISAQLCSSFSKNDLESLMDSYGLLLFSDYNDPQIIEGVNESNRRISTLITKNQIQLIDEAGQPVFFIDDNFSSMNQNIIGGLSIGRNFQTSPDLADVRFNNGNGFVSPGEVIGVIPNLRNVSNLDAGGIQILANDWNHFSNGSPSIINNFPSLQEGGSTGSLEVAPVCFAQFQGQTSTQWVSQSAIRNDLGLLDSQCLNPPQISGSDFDPRECFVRVLPGGNQSHLSSLSSQSNFIETLQGPDTSSVPAVQANNYVFLEVNKNTPPGTLFNCRLRVRFSNCSDCYSDGTNDYNVEDYEGEAPFQVINLQFQVAN